MNATKWLMALAMIAMFGGASGADMPAPPPVSSPPQSGAVAAEAQLEDYLRGRAALLALRSRFDVFDRNLVAEQLASERRELGRAVPDPRLADSLVDDLVTELSYYMVSLRYLIAVGGAVWPADRPESDYINDALVHLDAAKTDLLSDEFVSKIDPLALLDKLETVYWWTNGEAVVPAGENLAVQALEQLGGLPSGKALQSST